jgi:hypothetical protein
MSTSRGLASLLLAGALLAPAALSKVYVRWTQNNLPAPKVLGVTDLVIPWSGEAQSLVAAAKKQGYHAYLEANLAESATVAEAGASAGIAGIILKGSGAEETQLQQKAGELGSKYQKLKFLVLSDHGKQPEMRGWLVFKRDGILQVSSPTSQPWLDENLAMVRYERAFEPGKVPLYTFSWDLSDPLLKQNGPSPADYSLAVAEAGAFHADLVLELHPQQQNGLADGDAHALADWDQVKRTMAFYQRPVNEKDAAAVGIITDDYDTSYEEINLMARHNIPFRVLDSENLKPQDLEGLSVVIAFATLRKELREGIQNFAEQGGVAVLVNLPAMYPWDSAAGAKKNGHSVTYTIGKGRVIELGEPINDPETFAQDIRRLMSKDRVPVSLWNSLTTLVAEYSGEKPGEAAVELVNYAEEPVQVQVQVKGKFGSVRYDSPRQACCQELKPAYVDGFTQFVVPNLLIGGRVHLAEAK